MDYEMRCYNILPQHSYLVVSGQLFKRGQPGEKFPPKLPRLIEHFYFFSVTKGKLSSCLEWLLTHIPRTGDSAARPARNSGTALSPFLS